MTKKSSLLFICSIFAITSIAQTVKVKKETARIKSDYADGFEVELEAAAEEVDAALLKYMKTLGKTKTGDNYIVINEPTVDGTKYTAPLYAVNKQVGNLISAWIGIRSDEWEKKDAERVNRYLEGVIREFGINFYRDRIQKQIDESMRAAQAVERQQQRLQNENRNLNSRIESNKREKIQLEKSLENNKVELETLTQRLEKNKNDQDSVAVAGEQIKKVIEMHKEKQRKVN